MLMIFSQTIVKCAVIRTRVSFRFKLGAEGGFNLIRLITFRILSCTHEVFLIFWFRNLLLNVFFPSFLEPLIGLKVVIFFSQLWKSLIKLVGRVIIVADQVWESASSLIIRLCRNCWGHIYKILFDFFRIIVRRSSLAQSNWFVFVFTCNLPHFCLYQIWIDLRICQRSDWPVWADQSTRLVAFGDIGAPAKKASD